jgi:uncharacterized membrane protein
MMVMICINVNNSNEQLRGLALSLAVYLKVPLFIYMITTIAVMIFGWAALCYAATLLCIYRFLLLIKAEERSDTTQRIVGLDHLHLHDSVCHLVFAFVVI